MNESSSIPSLDAGEPQSGHLREILTDAIGGWERRRIAWPSLVALLVLAMLANLCYCAAYVADLPVQHSSFRDLWRRWRWSLWLTGTLFAILLANYWIADEIYSFVH
ncbi:MAG: hypothetical protein ACYC92_05420 [Candidatus Acidiferrales bacterium]